MSLIWNQPATILRLVHLYAKVIKMNRSTLVVCLMILLSSAANAHTVVKNTTVSNKVLETDPYKNSTVICLYQILESGCAFVINENEFQQLNTTAFSFNKYRQYCCEENTPKENESNNEELSYKYPESSLYYDHINKKLFIEQQHCHISDISICHCIKFSFQQKSLGKLNHVRRKYSSA